jgi:hypothetical protein
LGKNRVIFEKNSEQIIKNARKHQKSVTCGFFDKSDNREKQGGRSGLNSERCAGEQTTSPFRQKLVSSRRQAAGGRERAIGPLCRTPGPSCPLVMFGHIYRNLKLMPFPVLDTSLHLLKGGGRISAAQPGLMFAR